MQLTSYQQKATVSTAKKMKWQKLQTIFYAQELTARLLFYPINNQGCKYTKK